jgi:hypothetical protein
MTKFIKNFWSLNVDEALVANWLKQNKTLGTDYEIFFPINAQLEYVDLIVFNKSNQKTVTIQVKSSQSYLVKDKDGDYWASGHKFESKKIDPKKVDFFIFTCYYPKTSEKDHKSRDITKHFVVFRTDELQEYVKKIKRKNNNKTQKIGFAFYIYSSDDKEELYDDWELKEEYSRNNYDKLEPICDALDNFNKIKQDLK